MKRTTAVVITVILGSMLLSGGLHADGKELFEKSCKMCHGADGKGSPPMATGLKVELAALDLTKVATQAKTVTELTGIVSDGKKAPDGTATKMAGFKGKLQQPELDAVVQYVKTLK